MADTRGITITFLDGGSTSSANVGKTNTKAIDTESGSTDFDAYLSPVKTPEKHMLGKSVLLNQAFTLAKNNITQGFDSQFSRYTDLKEDYKLENTYSHIKTSVSKVQGVGASLITGAMVGATVGPVGALVGATVSLTSYGVSEALAYSSRMSKYNSQLNATNYGTNYNRVRAGLVDNGKGTEN